MAHPKRLRTPWKHHGARPHRVTFAQDCTTTIRIPLPFSLISHIPFPAMYVYFSPSVELNTHTHTHRETHARESRVDGRYPTVVRTYPLSDGGFYVTNNNSVSRGSLGKDELKFRLSLSLSLSLSWHSLGAFSAATLRVDRKIPSGRKTREYRRIISFKCEEEELR